MGKVSPQDFEIMAGRLRARALGIMKQLDAGSNAYRAIIEKELAQRLGRPVEPRPSQARRARTADLRSGLLCTCGTKNDKDARFCKSCGSKLEAA